MGISKGIVRPVLIALVAVATFAGVSTQASADVGWEHNTSSLHTASTCDGHSFCIFEHTSWSGYYYYTNVNATSDYFKNYNGTSDPFNDKASSVVSNSSVPWCLYSEINWTGSNVTVSPGQRVDNLGNYGMNDKVSSLIGHAC
ncbi:peptidase inhibitor family I36 protein [Streptomyces hyaluromycini]|uniref:peptidase inhibitor family I36 protein n=1 Tax=Streptomyces hyaluromycini TaxID=1377993 RepID=UPI000B5D04C3